VRASRHLAGAPDADAPELAGAAPDERARPLVLAGSALVAAAAVAVLVWLGRRQAISYDSFWHVFVARQETWASFWREVRANAHPPLYYLLLKVAITMLGNAMLAYRAVSIVAVAAAILSFGRIAGRLTASPLLAAAGTAAFGLSTSLLEMGLEVRSYALFLAFMIAALDAYARWMEDAERASLRTRATFCAFASLALLSHYSGFFLVGAAAVAPAVLAAADRGWRERLRREVASHPVADAVALGVPIAIGAIAYRLHVRLYPEGFGHVLPFLHHRGDAESALAFTVRNTRSLALLFLPGRWEDGGGTAVAIGAVLGFLVLAWAALRGGPRTRRAPVLFTLLLAMLAANVAGGLSGRYPYGGWMRHEVHLLPLLVLCLVAGLEAVRRLAPGRWSHAGAWGVLACAGVLAAAAVGIARYPVDPTPLGQGNLERFRRDFPRTPAVLVDQYNSIFLFALHHEWSWHLVGEWPGKRRVWQIWTVSRGGERFEVCRDEEWQLDFTKPSLYADVADCLAAARAPEVAVYRPQQWGVPAPWKVAEAGAFARALSGAAGLEPIAVAVEGEDVYASFRAAPRR
jgi:hypothetical protein